MSGVWVAIGVGALVVEQQVQGQLATKAAMKSQRRALAAQQYKDRQAGIDQQTTEALAAGQQRASAKRAVVANALALGTPTTQTLGAPS